MAVTDEVRDSYTTVEGGFVPEFDGTVKSAIFTFDNSYQNGEACLLELLVEPSPEDAPEFGDYLDDDGYYRIIYPCGKGWEPADKGQTAQHESGRTRRWQNQSGMGLLVNSAVELDGVADILQSRGPSTQADVWVGLKFRFEDKQFSGKNRDGDEITWSRRLPVEFHGVEGEGEKAAAKKAPAKKAPAKKAEAEDGDEGETGPSISPAVRGKLRAIAVKSDDHDTFMENAFAELPDMGDEAENAIADEAFFQSLKAG